MSALELRNLYLLHLVDSGLASLKAKVNGLDIGQEEAAEIKNISTEEEKVTSDYKFLSAEQKDLELKQSDMVAKAKRYEKDLYSGKIVNPREVESFEKEIIQLRKHAGELDDRLLELMEIVPEAEQKSKMLTSKIAELKKIITSKRESAIKERDRIKVDFDALAKTRPERLKAVEPSLLAKYEALRSQHNGIGMARVSQRDRSCEACGMLQADRTITHLQDGQLIYCENCKRILYYSDGAI